MARRCGSQSRPQECRRKKKALTTENEQEPAESEVETVNALSASPKSARTGKKAGKTKARKTKLEKAHSPSSAVSSALENLPGAQRKPMPTAIRPMLATAIAKPFDNPDWLFEIKWDGYRAVAFIADGHVRFVSRNQNDLTAQYPELATLPQFFQASGAVLDGEIVALDDQGRPSFSLMQQRTGFRPGKSRLAGRQGVPVIYYAFDLLYLDGFDLRRVPLERRKQLLEQRISNSAVVHFSDHFPGNGLALFEAAAQKGLEGIVAKKRDSLYAETRSHEWLKIKITQRQECVIGGYTDPEGSRAYFGSLVLGLYDKQKRLIHVGQAGTGFDQKMLKEMFAKLEPLATSKNPFYGEIGGLRKVHFVRPELVAEIKFSEWTHETAEGGMKLRAPVFMGLRLDKSPAECTFEDAVAT
jgi:bifunctional non-homologous end joining protein LigD